MIKERKFDSLMQSEIIFFEFKEIILSYFIKKVKNKLIFI